MQIKTYLQVEGMTCKSCESKIYSHIKEHPEINGSNANHVTGIVTLEHEDNFKDFESLISSIESDLGYTCRIVTTLKKSFIKVFPTLLGILTVLILYIISEKTGVLNNIPQINESMNYSILFIVGIMTSIHCIGMCGGINLSQTCSITDNSKHTIFKRGLTYNLGRLVSYTILGGIVGGLGSVLSISLTFQGIIIIVAGVFMMIMGANMFGLLSFLKKIVPSIPVSFGRRITNFSKNKSPFIIGLLNGFMPCGPLQSMQLYALSTGSFIKGAFSMFLFSTGTIPLMLFFGTLGSLFSAKNQRTILRISAFLILILGFNMITRGLSLNGISVDNKTTESGIAVIDGDRQIVYSKVTSRSYEPIIVQAGLPVEWTLQAGAGDINGCNNAIIVREYNIRQNLKEGETKVTFTPDKPGNYPFSCWMGMIRSNIIVVEDINSIDPELLQQPSNTPQKPVEIVIPDYFKEDITYSEIANGKQYAELRVSSIGFEKSIIIMQKNIETEWTFIPKSIDEKTSRLIFPMYNAHVDLIDGKDRIVELNPDIDIYFYSKQGDFLGFVILVDDIKNVDEDQILYRVRSYID